MDYQKDVSDDAVSFLQDHEEAFKEAIVDDLDFDRNDIDCLDMDFHLDITDRAYALSDAAYIIENCENEETDSGLWESQQPEDAIKTKAAFSYSMDVWFKCEKLFKEIKERYDEILEEGTEDATDGPNTPEDGAIDLAWQEFEDEYVKVEPFASGSPDEKRTLRRWLDLNANAGLRGGSPFGSAYIDARCGTGHGMPTVKDYVDFDREAATRLPHLTGKYKDYIKAYYEKTFARKEAE